MTIDMEILTPTKSLTTDDLTFSDCSDNSQQRHCEVPLGQDDECENPTLQMDDPAENEDTIILDTEVSVQHQSEVSPLKIENENCDDEFYSLKIDDPVISNSDTTSSQFSTAPANKEMNDDSDEIETNEEEWPEAFYCQRTHILMTDPLVGPAGVSFDRSAMEKGDDPALFYPNRALQAIIQETISLRNHPFRAGLKQLQQSVSHGLSNLLPEWNSHDSLFRPLNDAFYCPITYNLMHEPVIDPDGTTFERVAVENWIRINQSSPITRTELRIDQLHPNSALEKLLQEEKERPEDQMHPAIRKWKDEPMPRTTDVELGGRAVVESERRRQRQEADASRLIVLTRPYGSTPLFYPMTYQQLVLRRENNRRARYRVLGYVSAGCFLMTFVLNESLVFLLLFLLSLLFVFLNRIKYNI